VGEDEAPLSTNGPGSPQCGGTIRFSRSDGEQAISSFCNDQRWQGVIVPRVSFGHGKTTDGRKKMLGVTDSFPIAGNNKLWLGVSFAEASCAGMFQFDSGSCTAHLNTILNSCDGSDAKRGGWLEESCAVYRMRAEGASVGDPLFLQSGTPDIGDFTCTDTDTSAFGPGNPLEGTCACLWSRFPTVTDVFGKPEGGCSKVDRDADPLSNQ
jgi:hypothetical protein